MRLKMYKSGKNWMVAGLMTTAVLAGLTLSNVNNDVVAHAATEPATTAVAAQKHTVSQSQYNSQSTLVASDSAAVTSQQANFDSASNAVASATTANSNVNAVTSAQAADRVAHKNYVDLQNKVRSENSEIGSLATKTETNANSTMAKDWETNGAIAQSQANAKLTSATAAVDAATKAQDSTSTAQADALAAKKSDVAAVSAASSAYTSAVNANEADSTIHQLSAALSAAKAAVKADDDDYNQATIAHRKANEARLNAESDKTSAQSQVDALARQEKAYNEYTGNVAKLVQLRAQRDADKARLKVVEANANKAHAEAKQLAKDLLVPTTAAEAQQYQDDANNATNWMNHYKQDPAYTQHATDEAGLKSANDELATNQQNLADAQQSLKDDTANLEQAKKNLAAATTHKDKMRYQAEVNTYQGGIDTDNQKIAKFQNWIKGSQAKVAKAQQALNDHSAAYNNVMKAINDCQAKIDANKTAQANWEAYQNGAANLTALQAKLAQEQQTLKDLQDVLAKDQAILDNMVVEGNTNPSKPGDAVKPGNGSTVNVGNASVNGSNTEVANESTISASDVSADSNKASKQNAKLLQSGNSDSAAVVALGALSTMLGLGMVAKKREF